MSATGEEEKSILLTHQGGTLVVLDVALINRLGELDLLAETLLFEVPDGKLVGEGEEMEDTVPNVVVLEVVHEVSSISLNLLVGSNSAEHDLGEALAGEHAEANSPNGAAVLDQCQGLVFRVEYQAGDVLLGHPRQLVREDVLESDQPQHDLLGYLQMTKYASFLQEKHTQLHGLTGGPASVLK